MNEVETIMDAFQSHFGLILTPHPEPQENMCSHFNPILVWF